MSTPFTDPYSATATFHDLVGELALAFYQRRHAQYGPDYFPDTLQNNRDIQQWRYWANMQSMFVILGGQPNWVKYKSYGTWPPPVYASQNEVYAAAGLPSAGFRRATSWDGINDPAWQYGQMQEGDIIGPWIIEDLQKYFSALRWLYWAGESRFFSVTPAISVLHEQYIGSSTTQPTREAAQADAEKYYSLLYTTDVYTQVVRYNEENTTYGPLYEAALASTRVALNLNLHADTLNCPRLISVYANVGGWGTFDGFGDYDAPGYNHIVDYPAHTGESPEIIIGTGDKPLPWHGIDDGRGYIAYPQILIQWDFTNCNEV